MNKDERTWLRVSLAAVLGLRGACLQQQDVDATQLNWVREQALRFSLREMVPQLAAVDQYLTSLGERFTIAEMVKVVVSGKSKLRAYETLCDLDFALRDGLWADKPDRAAVLDGMAAIERAVCGSARPRRADDDYDDEVES